MRAPVGLVAFVLLGAAAAAARGDELAARAAKAYALEWARAPTPLRVGERAVLPVAIRCEPGVKVQAQAPLRASAAVSRGLLLAKDRLGWADARGGPEAPELELAVTATEPGEHEVRLGLEFFVCSRAWCVRQEREVVWTLSVVTAGPDARGPPASPAGSPETSAGEGRSGR